MKKSNHLLTIIGVVAALAIGFIIGISVDYPNFDTNKVAGTIGKVNNYRNTKVSEAAIELKNDLLSDTTKLKSMQKYLRYYYLNTVKMANDVDFALNEANKVEGFKTANKNQITTLTKYSNLLFAARTDLLMASLACQLPDKTNPIVLRNLLNKVNNLVAQLNFGDQVVLNFIDGLASFINEGKPGQYATLEKAHDLLAINEFRSALITKNKVIIKYLDKSKLLTNSGNNLGMFDIQKLDGMIQQDVEKLKMIMNSMGSNEEALKFVADTEKLKMFDANETGSLGNSSLNMSALKNMGFLQDGAINDIDILRMNQMSARIGDIKNDLGVWGNINNLDALYMPSVVELEMPSFETLGAVLPTYLPDAQMLGLGFPNFPTPDAQTLGMFLDAEKMGRTWKPDAEQLGNWDAEHLGLGW